MKVLLTGATGYIGKRLLPLLVQEGHEVVCAVRDPSRFEPAPSLRPKIKVVQVDLLNKDELENLPEYIDAAYYLVHSMSATRDYEALETQCANHFKERMNETSVQQVIYLTGIVNEDELSPHLASRKRVEEVLAQGNYYFTALRAGIIIGSGSASFEIIRDLVEKLPVMVAPKWLNSRCQPIGIRDVISFLIKALGQPITFGKAFDIAGPDRLTYKEMLEEFARSRHLKRWIFTVPVMTPRLSSYWLYFVTSTSYPLAQALVNSMKVNVLARENELANTLGIEPSNYRTALQRAFSKIDNNAIVSSWKDAMVSGRFTISVSDFIKVPSYGCFKDQREGFIHSRDTAIQRIWKIGGENGWYFANGLWRLRGFLDKLLGGVGLRRGRTHPSTLNAGDALDFWRVLYANKEEGRLLLFAEMKVPGEAWLEFKVKENRLVQTATFRPRGLQGRLYWYAVWPFHGLVFSGMLQALTKK